MTSLKAQLLDAAALPAVANKAQLISSVNYDPLNDLCELLDDPTALDDMELLFQLTTQYKASLDKQIMRLREEYNDNIRNNNDEFDEIQLHMQEVMTSYNDLMHLSNTTGAQIDSMTENIKKFDICKENLTLTMRTLKRLQMYTTAFDELERQIKLTTQKKDYTQIMQMFSVVLELNLHFQDYKSIEDVNILHRKVLAIKNKIVDDIFDDFEREYEHSITNPTLSDACRILELIGVAFTEKLQKWYISVVLKDINKIFKSTEEAGSLDNLKRRFIYFQNIITDFETKHLSMFPESWHMKLKIVRTFCSMTKSDLREVLAKETRINTNHVDVNLLLDSLSQTLEFEQYLNKKFKYYKSFEESQTDKENINFDKSISDVFEPYLNYWIDYQGSQLDKKLTDFLKPDAIFKKSGGEIDHEDENPSANVLESSAELFRQFRQMLSQLSRLTNGRPLIRLSKIYGKYLGLYQIKILESILPDSRSLNSAEVKDQEEGIEIVCSVLNTANYCSVTVSQLEEKIKSLIASDELRDMVVFEEQKNGFTKLINYCINLLIAKIENDLQFAWRELNSQNWKLLSEVTGESRYLTSVKEIVTDNCKVIFKRVSKVAYIRNIIDKLAESVLKTILNNIIKFEPVTILIAEQFKFDLQGLKTYFLQLPDMVDVGKGKISQTVTFKKHINKEFSDIDQFLKILMVSINPNEEFVNSYFTIIGDSSFSNFMKILNLKGVIHGEGLDSEKEKFKYMDVFKQQLKEYVATEELEESNRYLHLLKLPNSVTSHQRTRSSYLPTNLTNNNSSNGSSQLSPPPKQQQTGGASPTSASISAWLGTRSLNTTNDSIGGDDSFDDNSGISTLESSPKPNFGFFQNPKIDTASLLTTKDNLEKNLKTFADRSTFNEGFKRFFKRGD